MARSRLLVLAALAACHPPTQSTADGGGDGSPDGAAACAAGESRCESGQYQECVDGELVATPCSGICVPDVGCAQCYPGAPLCEGNAAVLCDDDGQGTTVVEECGDGLVCSGGSCTDACAAATVTRTNQGCEYWAVDLDNWYSNDPFNPDASAEQFSLVVTNPSLVAATVTVEVNEAAPGEPLDLAVVSEVTVGHDELVQIDLPQREVDGSVENRNDGTGTALTSRAFRVSSTVPIVAYQFNPIYQQHSNDASILIPTHALDDRYWAMGYPGIGAAVNPLSPRSTNYSFLTVVGTEPDTVVTVVASADVGAGGPVAEWTPAGTPIEVTLGPFDVLNLEAHCPPELGPIRCMTEGVTDFTGSSVAASAPVAVFAGVECANVNPPACSGGGCCCDHLEDQVFPASSMGERFVAPRSPARGGSEQDIWRVLADRDETVVTTSLPAPFHTFTLGAGAFTELAASSSFTISSTGPILVGQYLASQECTSRMTGDPSFTMFPPVEQFRESYTFLVPATFDHDTAVVVRPVGAVVTLDGAVVPEARADCAVAPAGELDGVGWEVLSCPLGDGPHGLEADAPVGLGVYGYGPAGSYAFPGGANVVRINVPE